MRVSEQPPGFTYARSADGTSIAWMRLGSGPRLIVVPPVPLSNVSGDWAIPLMRDVFSRLAASFELILYDGRGTGASQRAVDDLSVEAQAADLAAIIDASGEGSVALLAMYLACPAAITQAATRPGVVDHLILFGAADAGSKSLGQPGTEALLSLIDSDWRLFTRSAALDWMGWGAGEDGESVAESFRRATTPTLARAAIAEYAASDMRPLLAELRPQTLVLHRRDGRQVPMAQSAELAAAIPHGRLHVLDGTSATLFFDDPDATVDVITAFVQPEVAPAPAVDASSADASVLSPREREVLGLISSGDSNAEIAHRLGLSIHTVERHAANIYRKIDARGRADATAWALRHGLG